MTQELEEASSSEAFLEILAVGMDRCTHVQRSTFMYAMPVWL